MKKFFTLIAAVMMAAGMNAQTQLTLGGQGENGEWSWGWTQQFGASQHLLFSSQWGEFNLATSIGSATSYKLTLAQAVPALNLVIVGATSDDKSYVACESAEVTGEIPAGTTKIELQATEANLDVNIVSFVLITDGTEQQTTYSTAWGTAMYNGRYTTSEWAELYLNGAKQFETQSIVLNFNEAVPEGALQLKVYYADGTQSYPEVPAGTTASIDINAAVNAISLQAKGAHTIDIKSVESRTITTGIKSVNTEAAADNQVYNLAGQKVNGAYKGVVIKNGKKVLVK